MEERQLELSDIEALRAEAAHDLLRRSHEIWLIDEAERLLRERARMEAQLRRMRAPWGVVRSSLNELREIVEQPPSEPTR